MSKFTQAVARLIKPNATDENWKYFGEQCPYFGVVTWPQNRPGAFNEAARQEFFETGQRYVDWIFQFIRTKIDPEFAPRRAIDFGSGVGRLSIPIARHGAAVVGVEISSAMIAEAGENCKKMEVQGVSFVNSVSEIDEQSGPFDFINSFIVFQHIPPERGYQIFEDLIDRLRDGGIGAVHFTYCDLGRRRDRYLNVLYRRFPLLYALRNLKRGERFWHPRMEMAEYSLNRLYSILTLRGCETVHSVSTRHGTFGAILLFKKEKTVAL